MKNRLTTLLLLFFSFSIYSQNIVNKVVHQNLTENQIIGLQNATIGDTYVSTDSNKVFTIGTDGIAFLDDHKEVIFVSINEPLTPNLPQTNLDLLRFGRTSPYAPSQDDVNKISEFITDSGFTGRYFQTYYLDVAASNGLMNVLVQNSSLLYLYFYYTDFRASGTFPEIPAGSQIRQIQFSYSYEMGIDNPFPIPESWSNLTYINRIYFRRCGLTTAQVDSLVNEIETLVNNGMSSDASNLYVYLNQTGTGANESLTVSNAIANGWDTNNGYISKEINGKTLRIYHN